MDDINQQIHELINKNGKSASQMTHALKFIGDGNMEHGIERIQDYFINVGKKIGEMTGCIKGIVYTSLVSAAVILIKGKIEKDRKRKEEGQEILMGLEASLANEDIETENNIEMNE